MRTVFRRAFGRVGSAVALSIAVLTLAACGSAAQPATATDAPQPTAPQAAAAPTTAADAPPALLRAAPKFELPDTSGETVSLESYAGNKNVVVVFYRGFW